MMQVYEDKLDGMSRKVLKARPSSAPLGSVHVIAEAPISSRAFCFNAGDYPQEHALKSRPQL